MSKGMKRVSLMFSRSHVDTLSHLGFSLTALALEGSYLIFKYLHMNVARKKIRTQKETKAASIPVRTIAVQLFDERDGAAGWNCDVDDVAIISNRVAMLVTLLRVSS